MLVRYPENKYRHLNRLFYYIDSLRIRQFQNVDEGYPDIISYQKMLSLAIMDAIEYYGINLAVFWKNVEKWPDEEAELWNNSKNVFDFYSNWNGPISEMNACANIVNQMRPIELQKIVSHFFSKKGEYVDYGSGTATLSLGLKMNGLIEGNLTLIEVPNDIQDFVRYRTNKHKLQDSIYIKDITTFEKVDFADGLMCIDVLEHIENSSEVFITKISPIIKKGGILILRAPWRGHLTHLDCAADNFYYNGGKKHLTEYYTKIFRFGREDISCVYRKKK